MRFKIGGKLATDGTGMRQIRVFDIFCGAGGSSCGAAQAGGRIIGGLDLWNHACDTFQSNFPKAETFNTRLSARSPLKSVASKIGQVDLLLASPECTNHSVARGNRPRSEESRETAFQVIRFARLLEPRWIVVENVTSMENWHAYGRWLDQLHAAGYRTRSLKLNAQDFGVPQSRRRLFVIADRKRQPDPLDPPPISLRTVKSILQRDNADNGYSYAMRPVFSAGRATATVQRANRAIRQVGRKKPFLLVYYGSDAAGGWQKIDRPLRTITTLDRFALVRKVNGRHMMRMLQPPELAAAMGFPDNYTWPDVTRREHIKLIGNAVAPPVMKAIVESLCRK